MHVRQEAVTRACDPERRNGAEAAYLLSGTQYGKADTDIGEVLEESGPELHLGLHKAAKAPRPRKTPAKSMA
jgi:hypothetical protein